MPCQASTTPGKALLQPADAVRGANAARGRPVSTGCGAVSPEDPARPRALGGLGHWSAEHRAFGILLLIHSALMAVAMLAKKHPASAECALEVSLTLMRDWRTWAAAVAVMLPIGMIVRRIVVCRRRRRRSGA
ncbi:conserved hypothetical protein [Ralstonia solanacearum Po82]|uniref:Transmembrane protein n=1 Tax=Ralstonia solanacearum (strain Po82) TaxID=1031711 RepID=F6G6U0_RALS8|nr:hypothetical protein [Ralstonia solanacearum]AEG67635.1 conserved hypothetical protein [Ralstonia solanacearum Po82]AMP69007.1 hypothetical protein UW163_05705 [Ralstonia solanacearum]AMP74086.1 hypothetical protein RALBFv3_07910 [Ralstonia solanacearum]AYB59378.1 hypothetical protein C2124_01590 [Ralstonia solanacearum]MBB6586141.1 hypothetical protein [Ralstonia solanacearum]